MQLAILQENYRGYILILLVYARKSGGQLNVAEQFVGPNFNSPIPE